MRITQHVSIEIDLKSSGVGELKLLLAEINEEMARRENLSLLLDDTEKKLARSSKIWAIKAYRTRVGGGLKEALATVNAYLESINW